jgi:asparagine synthase (glutamine-hydrolysing)
MCGILGGIDTSFTEASLDRLAHRGPDQRSFVVERHGDFTVTLGETRLAIVDRHPIELPIQLPKKKLPPPEGGRVGEAGATVLFNGEIYNYVELRDDLSRRGWTFRTKTDTEVALAAYLEWGPPCLERFNGMFALAIWDGERFFCARDRMGKKPLDYRCRGKSFELASEIKAFDGLELVGHELFDLFEFCHDEHTLYRDVFQLRPGTWLAFDPRRGTLEQRTYWDVPQQVEPAITDAGRAVDAFVELLADAVRLRLRADVPVTLFLSGGIDSALLAKLSGVERAFTVQFRELADTIDEETYATDLGRRLGLDVQMVRPTREELLEDLPALAWHLEMPTGSFSVFPLYRLAKACRAAGYEVALSGEGSDELFAGYARNELLLGERTVRDAEKAKSYRAMLARYDGSDLDRFCRMASRSGLMGAALMKAHLVPLWSDRKSMLANICSIETRVFLQPLLQMLDRMTMAHGVEGRCPFLDHRLVAFAFSLHDALRYRDGTGKWIVREAARRLLPEGALTLERPVKHGLPTPVNLWMQGRHSFDRRYWNALLTAECIKSLPGRA